MKNKIRVLHVYRTYFPDTKGGIEQAIRQICVNSKSFNVESKILSLSKNPFPPLIEVDEIQVHRFNLDVDLFSCGFSIGALKGFDALVDWADIINFHFPWPFGDLLHFFSRNKKPVVVTYHSDIIRQKNLLKVYGPLQKAFFNIADVIVATSENYFASSKLLGRFSEKVEVIPLGIDESYYPAVSANELSKFREQFGEKFFLFVGVLRYYKGLHILLDALQGTSLQCVIVGSGPVENELKDYAKRLELRNVHFLGAVSDSEKVALFKLCRAVVFPSHLRSEAFGLTLLEGAMFRKPLISCEIGTGTSYVNLDGVTGYVVPPKNSKALREAMLRLQYDSVLASTLGNNGRNRYENLFTGFVMGQRYAQLYRKLSHKRYKF